MKLVVGLGNPGRQYAETRHNVGFRIVDEVARRAKVEIDRFDRDFDSLVAEAGVAAERVLLAKPQTYMNLSGKAVAAIRRFYKVELNDLLVVSDDLDLEVGQIRLRPSGSAGGQKGLGDVLLKLGSQEVPRMRIGIGKVHRSATVEYVLGRFSPPEREVMDQTVVLAADAVECWVRDGMTAAMNRYNKRNDSNKE